MGRLRADQRGVLLLSLRGADGGRWPSPSGGCRSRRGGAPDGLKPVADVVGPDLQVLFCGINPSLRSGETGFHFARPGNRFWPALHLAGFTPRVLRPDESADLLRYGVGVTNLVDRPTRAAADLSAEEIRAGVAGLIALVERWQPANVAVLGLGAFRLALERPEAVAGLQEETIAGRPLWALPNPSGLNAHVTAQDLGRIYGALRTG